jgi:hypothetical protein
MSVKLTTPTRCPLILAPGRELAETEGPVGVTKGVAFEGAGWGEFTLFVAEAKIWNWPDAEDIEELWEEVGTRVAGWIDGVGGPEEDGDTGSVTHIRWLLVAISLATVCARVFIGVTWKTGNESLPSFMPRVERMTLMKWMQVLRRRGSDDDLVRSFTSTVEILPMTLLPLSRMAREDTPSSMRRVRASIKGLSPLEG